MEKPLISVVTVSYNAVATIEQTILSVINQTYPNIEYIIIDGGSTDGTVDIIKKYTDQVAYWVSEPDKGIYDAMNKGIAVATGKWINFMNAGDLFCDEKIVSKLSVFLEDGSIDVIYGDAIAILPWSIVQRQADFSLMEKSMPFCHQSSFTKTQLMKKNQFDIKYKIAADFDFFYHLWRTGYRFENVKQVIAKYEAGVGMSATNLIDLKKERGAITNDCSRYIWRIKFVGFAVYISVINRVHRILPDFILKCWYKMQYK